MKKLLIAEASESFSKALAEALSGDYQVYCCDSGDEALRLLQTLRPDILIIDLALPHTDGLQVLQNTAHKPAIILALSTLPTGYVQQRAKDAGAEYLVVMPCTVRCVVNHIQQMERFFRQPAAQTDPQTIAEGHLRRLGISVHRAGFTQLRVGIPIFSQDEHQLMKKELYPAIGVLCGNDNPEQVEHSIREVIKEAWLNRDREVWNDYFPGWEKAPSNKAFIAVLAQKLRQDSNE